LFFQ
jgi:hypothetical protein